MNTEYIKTLEQKIDNLGLQLKITEEDRDDSKQALQDLLVVCIKVLECKDLDEAKGIVKKELHKTANK